MKFSDELISRVNAPTPTFFKTVRRVALTLGAIGTALLTAPVALPAAVTTVAGYLVAAGLVATAVSSAAVADGAGDGPAVEPAAESIGEPDAGATAKQRAPGGCRSAAGRATAKPAGPGTPGKGDRP